MALFLVTYDLHHQRDYPPVWAALARLQAVRATESLWLISTALTGYQVREIIQGAADADDTVLVIELKAGSEWSSYKLGTEGVAWLSNYVRRY